MNVWILGYGVPNERYPINGIFSYNQAKAIAALCRNVRVCYIALDIRSIRRWRPWGIHTYRKDGMDIVECNVPVGGIPQKPKNEVYYLLMGAALKKARQLVGEPDVLHAHFVEIAYALTRCRGKWKAPVAVTEHFSAVNAEKIDPEIRKMADYTYHNADCVIAVSPNFQTKIRREFGVEPIYIPNMVDADVFRPSTEKQPMDAPFHFVSVARLVASKNYEMMIRAFCRAFPADAAVRLSIAGDGPERERLEELVKSVHREKQILLLGQKSNEEIAELMRSSDCFALSSNSETFGVVCAEALMCGKPVISTRCGGTDCMVDEDNGILVPIGDELAMADAFRRMAEGARSYDAMLISKRATASFSCESVSESIARIYCKLAGKE